MERDAAPMSARMLLSVCSDGRYTVGSEELFLSFAIPRLLAMRLLGVAVFFITWWENIGRVQIQCLIYAVKHTE